MLAIVVVSGKLMEYFVDQYVMREGSVTAADLERGGEVNHKIALLKGEEVSSASGGSMSIYKSENALIEELDGL